MGLTEMIGGINNKIMHVQCSELIKEMILWINAACCCNQEGNRGGGEEKGKRGEARKKEEVRKRASEIKWSPTD